MAFLRQMELKRPPRGDTDEVECDRRVTSNCAQDVEVATGNVEGTSGRDDGTDASETGGEITLEEDTFCAVFEGTTIGIGAEIFSPEVAQIGEVGRVDVPSRVDGISGDEEGASPRVDGVFEGVSVVSKGASGVSGVLNDASGASACVDGVFEDFFDVPDDDFEVVEGIFGTADGVFGAEGFVFKAAGGVFVDAASGVFVAVGRPQVADGSPNLGSKTSDSFSPSPRNLDNFRSTLPRVEGGTESADTPTFSSPSGNTTSSRTDVASNAAGLLVKAAATDGVFETDSAASS